jgi:hypothetical protein
LRAEHNEHRLVKALFIGSAFCMALIAVAMAFLAIPAGHAIDRPKVTERDHAKKALIPSFDSAPTIPPQLQ